MGSPAISRNTFRGNRVDESRAGITPKKFTPLPYQNSPPTPPSMARLPDRWDARRAKTGDGCAPGQRPRSRGSSTSRSASPSMLKPNTASEIASPGQMAIHGARYMYERPEPESMAPQDG